MPVRMRGDEVVVQQPSNEQARDEANVRRVCTHDINLKSGDIGDVACRPFRVGGGDELGNDFFERRALLHHGAQLSHRPMGDDPAAMEHDDGCAQAFDPVEQVGAVDNRLAACREDRQQMTQNETRREVQSGFGLIENEQIGVVQQCGDDQHLLLHPLGVPADRLIAAPAMPNRSRSCRILCVRRGPGIRRRRPTSSRCSRPDRKP